MTDKAYGRIKEWIIHFKLWPGAHLLIDELAEALEMSRTPVREALSRLEQEHLVERRPMKGFVVKTLTLREVEDLYDCRVAVEELAVRQAATRMSPQDRDRVADTLDKVLSLIETGDKSRLLPLEQQYHIIILEGSGNFLLVDVGKRILDRIWVLQNLNILTSDHLLDAHREHTEIFNALMRDDSDEAARLMRRHLELAKEFMLSRFINKDDIFSQILANMGRG